MKCREGSGIPLRGILMKGSGIRFADSDDRGFPLAVTERRGGVWNPALLDSDDRGFPPKGGILREP
jgi:hypothetical protein